MPCKIYRGCNGCKGKIDVTSKFAVIKRHRGGLHLLDFVVNDYENVERETIKDEYYILFK